jgi:hypothetical protein
MAAYTTTSNAAGILPDDHGPLVVQPALNASVFATLSGIQTYVNAGAFGNLTSLPRRSAMPRRWRPCGLHRPADQEATFEELTAAAEWTGENPGAFVDREGAAQTLGVTPQHVGRLAARGRLPWLPTGRSGGQPTRVYRRAQIEVIARGRRVHERWLEP